VSTFKKKWENPASPDNPHTHIILRGRGDEKKDLIIAGEYISDGFRARAAELATEWLGPRYEIEILRRLRREATQDRWTTLDRTIQQRMFDGVIDLTDHPATGEKQRDRVLLSNRLSTYAG
jgi:type IV secretory pathway VirD2 relaxase